MTELAILREIIDAKNQELKKLRNQYNQQYHREYYKTYSLNNKEKRNEAIKRWKKANPEKCALYIKRWRVKNRERINGYMKDYRYKRKYLIKNASKQKDLEQRFFSSKVLCYLRSRTEQANLYNAEYMDFYDYEEIQKYRKIKEETEL